MHILLQSLLVLVLVGGCMSQPVEESQPTEETTPSDSLRIPERGFLMGFLPTPREGQSFEEAYRDAALYCDFVPVWGKPSPFFELADDLSGSWGTTFVEGYIRGNDMIPLVHLSFIDAGVTLKKPPGMKDATLADPAWREAYKNAALDVLKATRPLYLSLGNEVNRWYEKYGLNEYLNGFQHYITLYEEIYDAAKEISPETIVFCTFAREIVSENREADLEVLNLFDPEKIDIIALTSYPYAVQEISSPSDIPDDYYSRVLTSMNKPLGFTEVAWPSLAFFGGEQGQVDFLFQVCGRLSVNQGVDLYFVGWPWLVDLSEDDPTGLVQQDGTEKLAFTAWKELYTGGLKVQAGLM